MQLGLESIQARAQQTSVLSILNFDFNLTFLCRISLNILIIFIEAVQLTADIFPIFRKLEVQSEW